MGKLIALFLISTALSAQTLNVPVGKPIMLDGMIAPGEWNDAKMIPLGDFARLHVKQNNDDVLLAIEYLKAKTFTVDLYLSPCDGQIYDLHSSAKLGERTLKNGVWPEDWNWWNNQGWVATVSRVDSWDKRTFLDQQVREFQISRSRFSNKQWKLYFEFMSPGQPQWTTSTFPPNATNTSDKNWVILRLE